MKIHHLRNATMVLEANDQFLLIDPMLGPKGSFPSFTTVRFEAKRNPIVPLPENSQALLERVTHCLITHQHIDHVDEAGENYLKQRDTPVICSIKDERAFKKKGLNVVQAVDYWKRTNALGGKIEGIPARHGYGLVAEKMGNVMGFYLELPGQPSVYLSSDTIYTDEVDKVLKQYKPDVGVVACGTAQLDHLEPLLMKMEDILRFVKTAPRVVIANHLEAVNHCPTTRAVLREELLSKQLLEKVFIPVDGESIEIE